MRIYKINTNNYNPVMTKCYQLKINNWKLNNKISLAKIKNYNKAMKILNLSIKNYKQIMNS